ncbi:hypothetical protein AB0K60_03875 [Thermopolyspora sp. NPDC052614]|uniref:hypothetical protein n=1 Tax=Thermopolyspora sp. NPDC052614 TaxID=3155682 RepID=UPI00343D71AC
MIEPCWLVMYRVWARKFYAVPAWPMPEGLDIEADTVVGLQARMREAETSSCLPGRYAPLGGKEVTRDGE